MSNENDSHAERIQRQLDAVRDMLTEAINNEDTGKVASLMKLCTSTEAVLIKERIRAGVYVGQDEVSALLDEFSGVIIAIVKPFVTDDEWGIIVDNILDWVKKYNERFDL